MLLFMSEMTCDFAKAQAVHVGKLAAGKHRRGFFGAIKR
jgi:hypothetical protein